MLTNGCCDRSRGHAQGGQHATRPTFQSVGWPRQLLSRCLACLVAVCALGSRCVQVISGQLQVDGRGARAAAQEQIIHQGRLFLYLLHNRSRQA